MSEELTLYTVTRPSADELKRAINIANENGQGDAIGEEQTQSLLQLGAEIASLLEEGLTKENIHSQLIDLGLKTEMVDGVYEIGLKIHANYNATLKLRLQDLFINGTEQQKEDVMLLINIATTLKAEGKSKSAILAEFQSNANIKEPMANAVIELADEIKELVAKSEKKRIIGSFVLVGVIICALIYFFDEIGKDKPQAVPTVAEKSLVAKKSPQEMNCTDETLLLLARKLFVLQINEYSKPMTDTDLLPESSMLHMNKDSSTEILMNSWRISHLSPDSVSLADIKQVSGPGSKAPPESPDNIKALKSLSRNKTLYLCQATATIKLPEMSRAKIKELSPVVATTLNYKENENVIKLPVVYNTELNEQNRLIVGVGFDDPMTDMILSVLLRPEKTVPEDKSDSVK